MRIRARIPVSIVAGFILLSVALPSGAFNFQPGDYAPEFTLADLDGKAVTLSGFRGKTVLIVFWSTWCASCSRELAFLRDNFSDRPDVVVLLVNQDTDKTVGRERIAEMRAKLSLPFSVIVDSELELWDRFGIKALPTSVAVGKDGRVIYAESNFFSESPENLIRALSP